MIGIPATSDPLNSAHRQPHRLARRRPGWIHFMNFDQLMQNGWSESCPPKFITEPHRLYLIAVADELRERLLFSQTRVLQLEREVASLRKSAGKPSPSKIGNAVKTKRKIEHSAACKTNKEIIFDTFGGVCFYCRVTLEFFQSTIDHQIPRSKHGSNRVSNLVCACAPCNSAKGSRMPTQEELERADLIRSEYAKATGIPMPSNVVPIRDPWIAQMEAKIEASMKPSGAEPQLG